MFEASVRLLDMSENRFERQVFKVAQPLQQPLRADALEQRRIAIGLEKLCRIGVQKKTFLSHE